MTNYCGVAPLDMRAARVGSRYGTRPGRTTGVPRLHAGWDLISFDPATGSWRTGAPVLSPIKGVVHYVGLDTDRGATARGYGNCVVLEVNYPIAGLPNPFWLLFAHMAAPPMVRVGQQVRPGTQLGVVGNTSNGQFSPVEGRMAEWNARVADWRARTGRALSVMQPHTHMEVRNRPPPSSYERNTLDPMIFWRGIGFAIQDGTSKLLARVGGPSDCRGGQQVGMAPTDPMEAFYADMHSYLGSSTTSGSGPSSSQLIVLPGTSDQPGTDVDPPEYQDAEADDGSSSKYMVAAAAGVALLIGGMFVFGSGTGDERKSKERELQEIEELELIPMEGLKKGYLVLSGGKTLGALREHSQMNFSGLSSLKMSPHAKQALREKLGEMGMRVR